MDCPKCGGKTKIIDTYTRPKAVYRIRRCSECNETFDTIEHIFSGDVPRRWRKDPKDTSAVKKAENNYYTITCAICGDAKCFSVGKTHTVCTSSKCPAYYTPVPKKLDKEGAIEYLKGRGINTDG